MAQRCDVCGKGPQFGNRVSHAHNVTHRRFNPNLRRVRTLMDGIPESVAIGVSLLAGGQVGWVFVAAVFLSNIPESLSASVGLKRAGHAPRQILLLWTAIALASAAAAGLGFALLRGADPNLTSGIQAFAAGAVLTMLSSTMLPEAFEEGGPVVGLATTVGFLLAFSLSHLR